MRSDGTLEDALAMQAALHAANPSAFTAQMMRVYVTRDALTRGVRMVEGSLSRFGGMLDPANKGDAAPAWRFAKGEWATTRDEAEKQVARLFARERRRHQQALKNLSAPKKAGVRWEEA